MPELPEVEVCRADLARWTAGRRVVEVRVADPAAIRARLSTNPADALPGGVDRVRKALRGARTEALLRHGKRIGWRLAGRRDALLLHLGMTGRWLRRDRADEPGPRVRVVLELDDGSALWFEDARRFGCLAPVSASDLERELRGAMGPDALLEPPTATELRARLRGRRPVKLALMDQCVVAGIGNIHASEALWRARIAPDTPCDRLSDAQIEALASVVPVQLRHFVDEMSAEGEHAYVTEGGRNPFDVYDRAGEPCPRCGTPILRATQGGRSTYWCPSCQPATWRDVGAVDGPRRP